MSKQTQKKPNIWQVIISVLGAFIGVQSSRVRERDFQQKSPWIYIVFGLVLTLIFIFSVYAVVQWVLRAAGKV